MGRDLLAQDYILKQLTASLIYPEKELGQTFWDRVYQKAYDLYGTTEISVDTFHKVWIVSEQATVHQGGDMALVVENKLKVMLEEDYEAMKYSSDQWSEVSGQDRVVEQKLKDLPLDHKTLTTKILKTVIIPEIEREVNQGRHFANLRQIFYSLILATWYKRALEKNVFSQVYSNTNKTDGIDVDDKNVKQKIYDQYLAAFKKGVYDYLKEDYDPRTQGVVSRKYFSGGMAVSYGDTNFKIEKQPDEAAVSQIAMSGSNGPITVARTLNDLLKNDSIDEAQTSTSSPMGDETMRGNEPQSVEMVILSNQEGIESQVSIDELERIFKNYDGKEKERLREWEIFNRHKYILQTIISHDPTLRFIKIIDMRSFFSTYLFEKEVFDSRDIGKKKKYVLKIDNVISGQILFHNDYLRGNLVEDTGFVSKVRRVYKLNIDPEKNNIALLMDYFGDDDFTVINEVISDSNLLTKERIMIALRKMHHAFWKKGFVILDQELNNFRINQNGKIKLVDRGSLHPINKYDVDNYAEDQNKFLFKVMGENDKTSVIPLEAEIEIQEESSSPVVDEASVGGIDLNPELFELKIQGQDLEFETPVDLENIDPATIRGLNPVIYQMIPIHSVPALLGAVNGDATPPQSAERSLT